MIKRLSWIGTGTVDDSFRPNLPDGVSYLVVADHGDGTVTVEVGPEYEMQMMRDTIDTLTLALLELEP